MLLQGREHVLPKSLRENHRYSGQKCQQERICQMRWPDGKGMYSLRNSKQMEEIQSPVEKLVKLRLLGILYPTI